MRKFDSRNFTVEAINFLQTTLKQQGFEKVVLGLSGGVDSATMVVLAVKALGPKNVIVALMPYLGLPGKDERKVGLERDELKMVKELNISMEDLFFGPVNFVVDKIDFALNLKGLKEYDGSGDLPGAGYSRKEVKIDQKEYRVRKGNVMARVRMIFLFDLAKEKNALVLGTMNKSEYLLGYFTRYGDEAADIELIQTLYKTEVYQLAGYLGVPKEIIEKSPSAELWPGQTDEGEIGVPYSIIDKVLYYRVEIGFSEGKTFQSSGITPEDQKKVLTYRNKSLFKHKVPYILEAPFVFSWKVVSDE